MGSARIVEILCAMYDLPLSLSDTARGERQYEDVNRAVEGNSEVRSLISRLESYYDRVLASDEDEEEEDPAAELAPDVEQFLREVTGEGDTEEDR